MRLHAVTELHRRALAITLLLFTNGMGVEAAAWQ